ncbi:MAG: SRPBCC family protein [Candidatus Bipolaricaulia bacterium]
MRLRSDCAAPLLLLTLILVVGPSASAIAEEQMLSPEQQRRLDQGEVLVLKADLVAGLSEGLAQVIIDRPWEEVWLAIVPIENQTYLPRVREIRVLEQSGSAYRARLVLGFLWWRIGYTLHLQADRDGRRLTWEIDPDADNDLNYTSGYWELVPLATDRTLVTYYVALDIGYTIPGFIEDYLVRRDLPDVLHRLRERVMSRDGSEDER